MFTNIMTTFQQIFLGILILVIFFGVGIDNIKKNLNTSYQHFYILKKLLKKTLLIVISC